MFLWIAHQTTKMTNNAFDMHYQIKQYFRSPVKEDFCISDAALDWFYIYLRDRTNSTEV